LTRKSGKAFEVEESQTKGYVLVEEITNLWNQQWRIKIRYIYRYLFSGELYQCIYYHLGYSFVAPMSVDNK